MRLSLRELLAAARDRAIIAQPPEPPRDCLIAARGSLDSIHRLFFKNLLDDTPRSPKNKPVRFSAVGFTSIRVAGRQPFWRSALRASSTAFRNRGTGLPAALARHHSLICGTVIANDIGTFARIALVAQKQLRVPPLVSIGAGRSLWPALMVPRDPVLRLEPCRAFTSPQSGP